MKLRNSNYELLRIVAMFFIILFHIIVYGDYKNTITNPSLVLIFDFLLFIILVHVNSFVLLMGYFQSESSFKQAKIWTIINASFFYRVVITLIFIFFNVYDLEKIDLFRSFLYIDTVDYWFIKLYILLYILSPFLNIFINKINQKMHQKLLIILFIVFSVIPTITNNLTFQSSGFSIQHFIFLYFMGAYLKKYPLKEHYFFKVLSKSMYKLILIVLFFSLVSVNFLIYQFADNLYGINFLFDEVRKNILDTSMSYSNPIIIIQSVVFFLFFGTLNIKSKIINLVASFMLGVYLIHENSLVINFLHSNIKISNDFINSHLMIGYLLLLSLVVLIFCSIIEFVRQLLFKYIYNLSISKKIRDNYYKWLDSLFNSKESL